MSKGPGTVQQKILLLLMSGFVLGLSHSPGRSFRILKAMSREWRDIDRQALWRAIRALYRSQLVAIKKNPDGSLTLVLSAAGKKRALTFTVGQMQIKRPDVWDRRWRVVIFDIPERKKKIRDALRRHLQHLDFYELQKSVFVHPFPCGDEVDFLVELHQVRPYVRQLDVVHIDNELYLIQKFRLK